VPSLHHRCCLLDLGFLQLCSPVAAAPLTLNPVSELAFNPVSKTLNKLDSLDPPKGVKGPEVEGQFRKWSLPWGLQGWGGGGMRWL
jgi:hypothetical protein